MLEGANKQLRNSRVEGPLKKFITHMGEILVMKTVSCEKCFLITWLKVIPPRPLLDTSDPKVIIAKTKAQDRTRNKLEILYG